MALIVSGAVLAPMPSAAGELHTIIGTFRTADGVPYAGVPWSAEAADKSLSAQGRTDAAGNFSILASTSSDTRVWFANATSLGWQSGGLFCTADKGYAYLLVGAGETRLDIITQASHDVAVLVTDKFGKPVRNAFVAPGVMAEIVDGATGAYLPYGASTNACHGMQPQFSLDPPLPGTSSGGDGWTPDPVAWIGGWIPGREGGTTPSTGTVVISTPGPLPAFSEDFARVVARVAVGVTQRTTVPMSAIQGSDEGNRGASAVLSYAPIMEDAAGATDVPGEPAPLMLATAATSTPQVLVRRPTGEPLAGVQVHMVPVLVGDTPTSPREGGVVATAVTGPDGRASFLGLSSGPFRAIPGNVAARTVDFTVAASSVTPPVVSPPVASPPVVTPPVLAPSATARVKATGKRSKLFVDVNPNVGKGYWTFGVERKNRAGSWIGLRTYRTKGAKETRTINLKKGTYRVVVNAKYGYQGSTSTEVFLKK